jgi:hypothetical protein
LDSEPWEQVSAVIAASIFDETSEKAAVNE